MTFQVDRPVRPPGFFLSLRNSGVDFAFTPSGLEVADLAAYSEFLRQYTLDDAKANKRHECSAVARSKYEMVTAGISPAEMAGWSLLVTAAEKYRKDGTAETPIASEAAVRGIPVADLVAKIESNATKFQQARAAIAGTDGKKRDEIDALTTFEEVAAYDVNTGWPI